MANYYNTKKNKGKSTGKNKGDSIYVPRQGAYEIVLNNPN